MSMPATSAHRCDRAAGRQATMAFFPRNERASPSQQAVCGLQKLLTIVLQRASTSASTKLHRMALRGTGLTRRLAEPKQASRGGFQSAIDFHGLIERGPLRRDTSCRTLTCSEEAARKAARWSARRHKLRTRRSTATFPVFISLHANFPHTARVQSLRGPSQWRVVPLSSKVSRKDQPRKMPPSPCGSSRFQTSCGTDARTAS